MPTTLITGASSGLGAEMARQLADRGWDLALAARRTERLEGLRDEIVAKHPGRRVELRALDVTDDDQVFEVFAAFRDDFGTIDRVIVNAGLGKGGRIGTVTCTRSTGEGSPSSVPCNSSSTASLRRRPRRPPCAFARD